MSKPCRAIAENFDAWIGSLPTPYRQAWYRGRAIARRQIAEQSRSDDRAYLHHQNALGIYEARAEAGE